MHALVWEEAPLHELTSQVTDVLCEGRAVVHGPWTAAECQSVLIPWHAAGWIELVADVDPPLHLTSAEWRARASRNGTFLVLSVPDAVDLLENPARWIVGTDDGQVMLCRTDEGDKHDYAEWLELADRG